MEGKSGIWILMETCKVIHTDLKWSFNHKASAAHLCPATLCEHFIGGTVHILYFFVLCIIVALLET